MVVAYGLSKTASYSKEMSESWYVAEVSPVHKITFSEEFSSSLTIKSSLRPYGYTGCLKKSKSNGIANRLSNVFLTTFSSIVNASAVPSDFSVPSRPFNPIQDGHYRGYSGMGGRAKRAPLPKIYCTYPTMMKLGTVIPYLKKIRKIYESRDTPPDFC